MASYSWKTNVSGDWNIAADWTPATVPGAADDVTIDAATTTAGGYTVTIAAAETETVNSLTMNAVNNLNGSNTSAYTAAELELDGTLAFAAGSAGSLDGSLQTIIHTAYGSNAEIINGGTINGFLQVEGNLLITGTNGVYITNDLQALAGTVTIDTKSIAEMTGTTLFDGIFEAKGPGAVVNLGGALQKLTVDIATIEGPPLNATGWTELTFNDTTAAINEWNGTGYVSVETTLTDIKGGGTVDVLDGRNYTTANTLTVEGTGTGSSPGLLNLHAGVVTAAGIAINSGGIVQGSGTIAAGVVNNGTLIALAGTVLVNTVSTPSNTLDIIGALTGTGTVLFDVEANQFPGVTGPAPMNPVGATLEVNSVSAGQTIVMNGDDTLKLDDASHFLGTIQAGAGDTIVLQGVAATSAVLTNGTLVVSNGATVVDSLKLAGSYTGDSFTVTGSTIAIGTGAPPSNNFTVTDTTTGVTASSPGTAYSGTVAGIANQYVTVTTDALAITATAPNSFIHTGSGDDAIDVSKAGGTNVLDGSTGSNFLVGGSGFDTFFLDDRGPAADVFSTVVGFHSGDNATIFGVTTTDFKLNVYDNQGAAGYTGVDFSFTAAGKPNANLVLAGYTSADLTNGKLSVSYGVTPDQPGAPGSTYMLIHAN
jgi:hypothetical protein